MGDLLARMSELEALHVAWNQVERNDGREGADGVTIAEYGLTLEENLEALQRDLRSGAYQPGRLLRIWVPKPGGGQRPLSVPTVRDRVTQTAAADILRPILEPEFEDCSFGYRRGRSVADAVRRVEALRNGGCRWVVDADIDGFFDHVRPDRVLSLLRPRAQDPELLGLVERWLRVEIRDGETILRLDRGLPQGLPISPLLANLYLDRFDEETVRRGYSLVRYADDFLILCKRKEQAEAGLRLAAELLAEAGLRLHPGKTRIVDFERGFHYLGTLFVGTMALPSPRRERGEETDGERHAAMLAPPTRTPPMPRPEAPETQPGRVAPVPRRATRPPTVRARTLYVQEQGAVVAREGERFVVRKGPEVRLAVPRRAIDQIFVFGRCALTTPAITWCLEEQIPVVFLSATGRYHGVLDNPVSDRVSLHRHQFERAGDASFCLATARTVVAAKIHNSRAFLQRHHRRRPDSAIGTAIDDLDRLAAGLGSAATVQEVSGYEGAAAARYFHALGRLVDPGLGFVRRVRRPPTDPVNSLLSLGYTLLFSNMYSLVRARGLHPGVGALHAQRDGHPALAFDLVEEFRTAVIDALVVALFNYRVVTMGDFFAPNDGAGPCLLRDDARARFLHHFERKLAARVTHVPSGQIVDWRGCMDLQVSQFIQYLRGEIDSYRPMLLR